MGAEFYRRLWKATVDNLLAYYAVFGKTWKAMEWLSADIASATTACWPTVLAPAIWRWHAHCSTMHLRPARTLSTPKPTARHRASCAVTVVPRCSSLKPSCVGRQFVHHRSRRTPHDYPSRSTPPASPRSPQAIWHPFACAQQMPCRALTHSTNRASLPCQRHFLIDATAWFIAGLAITAPIPTLKSP